MSHPEIATILEMLERIEGLIRDQKTIKEFYSTDEVAEILDRSSYTIREWCRQGRVTAQKRPCGRGTSLEWIISHAELERVRNHGLLRTER